MNTFGVLFKKELHELFANGKGIWLPISLILLGITQPLTNYYMPQIINMAGNLPKGAIIQLPTPTGQEVMQGVLSQYSTIGTLLIVLASMNMISNERQNHAAVLVMMRPVSIIQYIMSKWAAQIALVIGSTFISYIAAWYYTNLLFSYVDWTHMVVSFLLYSLWLIFILSVLVAAGTFLLQSGGIAGVSILIIALLSFLSTLFTNQLKWSPAALSQYAARLLEQLHWSQSVTYAVVVTLMSSFFLLIAAVRRYKKVEYV
ncbi:ABC transporter permease [Priestia megaterium]